MKCKNNRTRYFQNGGKTEPEDRSGSPIGGYLTTGVNLLSGIGRWYGEDAPLEAKEEALEDETKELAKTQFSGSNAALAKQSTMLPIWEDINMDDLGGAEDVGGSILGGAASGAMAGAQTGNPWVAAGAGIIGGLIGGFGASDKNREKRNIVSRVNQQGRRAEEQVRRNFNSAVGSTDALNDRWRLQNMYNTNYAAFGGLLETNGADWRTGAAFIDNGGTHQENPFGGVQFGIASDGLPNLVEEGEVVIKVRSNPTQGHSFAEGGSPTYDNYVVSNREFPILEEIAGANITENPEQYVGMSWADIYKDIFKKSHIEEVINRQDSQDYIDILNDRVAQAHEGTRLRNQQEAIMDALKKATPEQQDLLLQQAGYPNLIEEAAYAAHGGQIHIKPSKRGTFTAAATKHGMGVQEFASKVLANKEDYSPAMVKKANFARNASHWHQAGGYIPYDNSKGFDYFNNGSYDEDYLNWLNNRDWSGADKDVFGRLSDIYKQYTGKTLTPETATRLGQDKKFGPFHQAYGDEYKRFTEKNNTPSTPTPLLIPTENTKPWSYDFTKRDFSEPEPVDFLELVSKDRNTEGIPFAEPYEEPTDNSNSIPADIILAAANPETQHIAQNYWNEQNVPSTDGTKNIVGTKGVEGSREDENEDEYEIESVYDGSNTDWFLPAMSGLNVLSDAMGWTNNPDYSNARRIERAILPPTLIGYNPNGRYVKPLLTDKRYIASRLGNQGAAAIGAAKDLSGSNRATALNNIALNNYLNNLAIGQAMAQTDEANNAALREAITLNNQVDRANAEGMLQADRANQSAKEAYANRYATQKTQGARMREDIDEEVAKNRSANWNNFLENLQGYFDNQRNRNMANSAYQGTGYWIDKSGTIHYTTKNPSAKTKKEAEKKVKELNK